MLKKFVDFATQNAERQVSLGIFLADDHSKFSIAIVLPLDMQYGEYEFRVTDEKNQVATVRITFLPDVSAQEGSEQREDSDGCFFYTFTPGDSCGALSFKEISTDPYLFNIGKSCNPCPVKHTGFEEALRKSGER